MDMAILRNSEQIAENAGSFQRVPILAHGRYMLEDLSEYRCQVTAMSPGDAVVIAERPGRQDGMVIAYIDHIGRIEGNVLGIFADGFIMSINASDRKRDKLAAQLTWLANKHELNLPEDRRHERIAPHHHNTTFSIADGDQYSCSIIDLSESGAALRCEVMPEIGTEVRLGTICAHVVRHIPNGIAIAFVTQQSLSALQTKFSA